MTLELHKETQPELEVFLFQMAIVDIHISFRYIFETFLKDEISLNKMSPSSLCSLPHDETPVRSN